MPDLDHSDDFREYRRLILAHMEASTSRQSALEDGLLDMRVQMGVLVVKVSLIVAVASLVLGTWVTVVIRQQADTHTNHTTEATP